MSSKNSDYSYLKAVDDAILYISQLLDSVKYLNPTNTLSERTAFFEHHRRGQIYNPQYGYPRLEFSVDEISNKLQAFDLKEGDLEVFFRNSMEETKRTLNLFSLRGNKDFSAASKDLYGIPSQDLVQKAYEFLLSTPNVSPEPKCLSAEYLRQALEECLASYGFTSWRVFALEGMTTKVTVDPSKNAISLNKREMFSGRDVARLKVHEIGTHVLRSENGKEQPFKIFQLGLADSLTTEEGLAAIAEEKAGVSDTNLLRLYAGRVIAVHLSLKYSFYEVFKQLVEFFSEADAYYLVQRTKKGLRDTSCPGAYTKDHVYFAGREQVKQFLSGGGDIRLLYTGAIGVRDVDIVYDLIRKGILKEPKVLPSFL